MLPTSLVGFPSLSILCRNAPWRTVPAGSCAVLPEAVHWIQEVDGERAREVGTSPTPEPVRHFAGPLPVATAVSSVVSAAAAFIVYFERRQAQKRLETTQRTTRRPRLHLVSRLRCVDRPVGLPRH
jgi:hypothetical protein